MRSLQLPNHSSFTSANYLFIHLRLTLLLSTPLLFIYFLLSLCMYEMRSLQLPHFGSFPSACYLFTYNSLYCQNALLTYLLPSQPVYTLNLPPKFPNSLLNLPFSFFWRAPNQPLTLLPQSYFFAYFLSCSVQASKPEVLPHLYFPFSFLILTPIPNILTSTSISQRLPSNIPEFSYT